MADNDNAVPAEPVAAIEAAADASPGGTTRRAPRRRSATKKAETSEAGISNGSDSTESVTDAALSVAETGSEPVEAAAPRPRTRRRRTPAAAAAETSTTSVAELPALESPALDPPAIAEEQTELVTAEVSDITAGTSVEPVPEPATPPAPAPASAWSPRRRYEIGPDGTVRFLDDRTRGSTAPSADRPATATPATSALAAAAEAAPAEEPAPPTRALYNRRRDARRSEPDLPSTAAAEAAPETEIVAASVEPDIPVDDVAEIDQGFIEGEESAEGGEESRERRRRRSRRGGRGRRRNGATPEGTEAVEALDLDLDEAAEAIAPVVPALEPEAEVESPRVVPTRERPDRSAGGPSPLESLVARQNVILDQLLQRQERMARSMELTLKSVESRLRGTDLSHVSAMPRIAVFVDVPNIMYAAERYRVAVDFGKLLDYVAHDRTLIRASAYAPISDDPTQRLEAQRFVEPFVNHGYRIVTKPLKRFADGSIKANFDVELAMDILTMSDRLDIVSLVSGDGDFRRLVDIVASKGVRVEVVSFAQSTSAELKAVADTYIDLTQHLKDLCVPVEGDFKPRVPRPRIDISGYYE
jgi:uncharacterized LabA/DUF88 family protein